MDLKITLVRINGVYVPRTVKAAYDHFIHKYPYKVVKAINTKANELKVEDSAKGLTQALGIVLNQEFPEEFPAEERES